MQKRSQIFGCWILLIQTNICTDWHCYNTIYFPKYSVILFARPCNYCCLSFELFIYLIVGQIAVRTTSTIWTQTERDLHESFWLWYSHGLDPCIFVFVYCRSFALDPKTWHAFNPKDLLTYSSLNPPACTPAVTGFPALSPEKLKLVRDSKVKISARSQPSRNLVFWVRN